MNMNYITSACIFNILYHLKKKWCCKINLKFYLFIYLKPKFLIKIPNVGNEKTKQNTE